MRIETRDARSKPSAYPTKNERPLTPDEPPNTLLLAQAVVFLRETSQNDGAKGEAARLLCDEVERLSLALANATQLLDVYMMEHEAHMRFALAVRELSHEALESMQNQVISPPRPPTRPTKESAR